MIKENQSKWNSKKAVFAGYNFKAPKDGDYMFDIDQVIQPMCKDGYYRFLCLEIKHPREDMSKLGNQINTLHVFKRDGIPTLVCIFNPRNADIVEGKITDCGGNKLFDTKTAWYEVDDLIVKAVYDCGGNLKKLVDRANLQGKNVKLKKLVEIIKERPEDFPELFKFNWNMEDQDFYNECQSKLNTNTPANVITEHDQIVIGEEIKPELKQFIEHPITPKQKPTEFDEMFAAMEAEQDDYWNRKNDPRTILEIQQRNLNWEW